MTRNMLHYGISKTDGLKMAFSDITPTRPKLQRHDLCGEIVRLQRHIVLRSPYADITRH